MVKIKNIANCMIFKNLHIILLYLAYKKLHSVTLIYIVAKNLRFLKLSKESEHMEAFKAYTLSILSIKVTGWSQKKFMMWSGGKVFEKFYNIFWWSLSLYIFTSSQ